MAEGQVLIALVRAVNVGGTGVLPMAELRAMGAAAGLHGVRSYIQSGNLVGRSAQAPLAVKVALEALLAQYAGKPVAVLLRTGAEMRAVLQGNPFPEAEPARVGVLFLDHAPDGADLVAKGQVDEVIRPGPREVYVHYPAGMGRSKLRFAAMAAGTVRNINTVGRLVEMGD